MNSKKLCLSALFAAGIFIFTALVRIPIPLGYANLGSTVIFFCAGFLPLPYALISAVSGSILADLISFPIYALPTAVIKALVVLIFKGLMKLKIKKLQKELIASITAMVVSVMGYFFAGCFIYGSFIAGISQLFGLTLEAAVNVILYIFLENAFIKRKDTKDI